MRVVVVTGDGDAFCVGADARGARRTRRARRVRRRAARPKPPTPATACATEFDHDLVWHYGLRLPVIIAINGACAGVGMALACFCDLRFAVAGAKITTAAPQLGLPAEYGLSWVLPRPDRRDPRRPTSCSRDASSRERRPPRSASSTVCCHQCPNFVRHVGALAHRLATEVSPSALRATKHQLYDDLLRFDVGASVEEATSLMSEMMGGADFAEGVAALLAKRPPRF